MAVASVASLTLVDNMDFIQHYDLPSLDTWLQHHQSSRKYTVVMEKNMKDGFQSTCGDQSTKRTGVQPLFIDCSETRYSRQNGLITFLDQMQQPFDWVVVQNPET